MNFIIFLFLISATQTQTQTQTVSLQDEIISKLQETFPSFTFPTNDDVIQQQQKQKQQQQLNMKKIISITVQEYKETFKKDPPRNYDRWIEFALRRGVIIKPSHYKQINSDFLPFRGMKITKNQQDKTLRSSRHVYKVRKSARKTNSSYQELEWRAVINEGRTILPKSFSFLANMIDLPMVMDIHPLTDDSDPFAIATIENSKDLRKVPCIQENYSQIEHSFFEGAPFMSILTQSVPILGNCKLSACFNDILVPIYELLEPENVIKHSVPEWNERKDDFVFRGSSTGLYIEEGDESYKKNVRVSLIDWSNRTGKGDSGFNQHLGGMRGDREFEDFIMKYPAKQRLTYEEQQNYKYSLVLDGYAWAARLPVVLSYGFVGIYQTIFISWITAMLRPFIDYIPLPYGLDFEYLGKVLKHYGNDQKEAEKIAISGAERISMIARKDDKIAYILLVLLEYIELLDETMVYW